MAVLTFANDRGSVEANSSALDVKSRLSVANPAGKERGAILLIARLAALTIGSTCVSAMVAAVAS